MLKLMMQKMTFHVKENITYYGICAAALLCGVIVAAVCAFSLTELNAKELTLYFNDFFTNFTQTGADSSVIFLSSLKSNALLFVLLALFSTMIVGAPFIVAIGLYSGFTVGFTVVFLFKTYGLRTLLFLLGGMLPHALITLPCHLMLLAVCLRFSVSLTKDRSSLKNRLTSFFFVLLALFAVSIASSLLQAYIEPVLLGCFSGYFVA